MGCSSPTAVVSYPPYCCGAIVQLEMLVFLDSCVEALIYLRHTKSPSACLIHLEVVQAVSGGTCLRNRLLPTNYSAVNAVQSYEGRRIQMRRLSPSFFALINSHNVGSRPLFRLCSRHDSWISAYQKWSAPRIQTHSHAHTCHTLRTTYTSRHMHISVTGARNLSNNVVSFVNQIAASASQSLPRFGAVTSGSTPLLVQNKRRQHDWLCKW